MTYAMRIVFGEMAFNIFIECHTLQEQGYILKGSKSDNFFFVSHLSGSQLSKERICS